LTFVRDGGETGETGETGQTGQDMFGILCDDIQSIVISGEWPAELKVRADDGLK